MWGSELIGPMRVDLVGSRGEVVPVEAVALRDGSHLAVAIPEGVVPGAWTVRVQAGETTLFLPEALTVVDESAIAVCGAGIVANTRVSLVQRSIRIQRFSDLESGETVDVPISNVRRVELDAPGSDVPCSVIWLRLNSGRRVAFDQSRTHALRARAERLAGEIARPFVSLQGDDVGEVVDSAADAD